MRLGLPRASALACAVLVAACLWGGVQAHAAAPAAKAPAGGAGAAPVIPPEPPEGNPDPFRQLGAGSPFCRRRGLRARAGCRISGSIAHTYPASNYGLDIQIETSLTKVEDNLFVALQSVAALTWLGLVYALNGVLLLLEWAFSLDLLNEAMGGVRRALADLHRDVLGRPWFLAAIAVAGLWGIWRGLVQGRAVQTVAGLAATVGLMVLALALIANPTGTVGHASKLANEGALGFMSAASRGTVDRPADGFASASERLFDALVLRPWCALEFGDVEWCMRARHGGYRIADLWLSFPADGKEREALFKLTKGEDPDGGGIFDDLKNSVGGALQHGPGALPGVLLSFGSGPSAGGELPDAVKDAVDQAPAKVRMQEKSATFTRIALLCMIALGLAGAICLLLYLAIKLVLAGLLALILLLLAPAMLLAPAFGESGRATFVAWIKRLIGALVAKLVYALLLALVVVAATALAALDIGWFGTWLLQTAFWWGILIKRKELTGFLSVGQEDGRDGPSKALRLYQQARAGQAVGAAAGALALAPARKTRRVVSGTRLGRQEAHSAAVGAAAKERLDQTAERARAVELEEARAVAQRRPALQQEQRAVSRALQSYDDELVLARAADRESRAPYSDERALLARRERIERELVAPELRRAEATVREADRALAREGRLTTAPDREAWREQRRRDIRAGMPADHERNLRAAGIDPREYRRSDAATQAQLRERSTAQIERDRRQLAGLPEGGRATTAAESARAATALPREELRRRVAEQRATWQHERRIRQRRQHLYRR